MKFAPYTSGKLRKLKVGITSDPQRDNFTSLEVLGGANIVGIVSATSIFISTTTATSDFANLNVSGISTFVKSVGITSDLNVTGISTFTGVIDANGGVDISGGSGLNVTGHTELDDVNVSGIVSAPAFANFGYLQAPFGSTVNFTVTVAGKDATHRYNGQGSGNAYLINGVQSPVLTLTPGRTYRFTNNNTGSHPLKFYYDANRTTLYTTGVNFQNTYTEITISDTTPNVLHYQCTNHALMGNAIITNSNVVDTPYDATFRGNIVGDNATNISGINSVTATKFFGDGSGLENTGATLSAAAGTQRLVLTSLTSGTMTSAATDADVTFNANTDTLHVGTGVTIFGGTTGIVSAVSYNGDLIIGTPTGGFKTGAFTITSTDKTKDSINELNNILGKLVPSPPDTINGQSISLTGTAGVGRLCAGFTPTNNTGGSAPVAGTQYTRNTDSTVSTNFLTEFGPGDSGTVTGFVNAVGVGTTTLSTGNNDGTYDSIQIANNEDAEESTRNPGIASGFYQIYDLRMVNGASPDGFNLAKFTQGTSTTGSVFWYEDPSTVGAPVISFGNVQYPSSPTLSYSSGIPHYTESTNNNFTYVMTVTNASGDMYTQNTFVNSDGQTGAFQNPGNKSYTNFDSGTNPPVRNYGVGTGVTTLITQTPRNLHATVTSNIFTSFDASTPYGSHNNQRVGFTTDFNIMGTTADFTNNVDEDAIECTVGSLTGGSATRVPAISGADNPSQSGASYSWGGGSAGSIATYEATVRGGDLRHDQTDYSTGYLPVGPNYSASRSGSQYFQFQFIQSSISEFQISYTGSLAGCWVCMPDNSTWTTSLSGVNGWADMFQAYKGSGVPTTAEPGCSSGGVMDTNGGTFTCVFGTESSSNDSNNRVLIRFKLTSGNSISDISLSDT